MKQMNNEEIIKEFREKHVPSSLKWKDAVHCTCCSTEEEYKEIESFLLEALAAKDAEIEEINKDWETVVEQLKHYHRLNISELRERIVEAVRNLPTWGRPEDGSTVLLIHKDKAIEVIKETKI